MNSDEWSWQRREHEARVPLGQDVRPAAPRNARGPLSLVGMARKRMVTTTAADGSIDTRRWPGYMAATWRAVFAALHLFWAAGVRPGWLSQPARSWPHSGQCGS